MAEQASWALDAAARKRIDQELARITRSQANLPRCRACGQPVTKPIRGGFCHRETVEHDRLKAEVWQQQR